MTQLVLALEGNQEIAKIYVELLADGYEVEWFPTLAMLKARLASAPDAALIITELSLLDAEIDDIAMCLKGALPTTPVLIVSKVDCLQAMHESLKSWASDFLTKPFNNNEFVAKCRRLTPSESLYVCDSARMTVKRRSHTSDELTSNEFRLLTLLAQNDGYKVSMDLAHQTIWGNTVSTQRMHTLLSRLRPKVKSLDLQLEVSKDGMVAVMTV